MHLSEKPPLRLPLDFEKLREVNSRWPLIIQLLGQGLLGYHERQVLVRVSWRR